MFILNSILLGVGLAMDAFSVSLANGISDPCMPAKKSFKIAGTFGIFQTLMPLAGWHLVRTAAELFSMLKRFIPWISLFLLLFIGGKMLFEGIKKEGRSETQDLRGNVLLMQGLATSIDALSVGFTIADHKVLEAFVCTSIIGIVTFVLCLFGLRLGKKISAAIPWDPQILGGIILIIIGIEIFVKGTL